MHSTRNAKSLGSLINTLAVIALCIVGANLSAQKISAETGSISGNVLDVEYGGTVSRARVTIVELAESLKVNMEGKFLLDSIPEGEYTVLVTAEYYKAARVTGVKVSEGEITHLDVPMYNDTSDTIQLAEFVVKAEVLNDSDLGLLNIRKNSASVSDSIGAEAFGRLGLGDAADALTKVTGVSITDGKYMVVRGLSDRYNNTTMNGASVPSSDPDKRAVQLDQFPTGIIESITTVKTFTPDLSGSFTAGNVDIKTKSVPDRSFVTLKVGFEYNDNSTFKDILSAESSGDDWLGKDDGSRAIPAAGLDRDDVPGNPLGLDDAEKQALSDLTSSFNDEFSPGYDEAPLGHSASVSFGNRFLLGDSPDGPTIGVIGSISNKTSFEYYQDGESNRYEYGSGLTNQLSLREERGEETNDWGTIFNIAFKPNTAHEIGLNTSYNQSGTSEAVYREGFNLDTVGDGAVFRGRNIHYTERTLGVNQLYGKHMFEGLNYSRFEWSYAKGKSVQDEPDYRLFYDIANLKSGTEINPDGTYNIEDLDGTYDYDSGTMPAPRRYWRRLDEDNEDIKFDFILPIASGTGTVKFGYQTIETNRAFVERSFSYNERSRELPVDYVYSGNPNDFLDSAYLALNEEGDVQRYVVDEPGNVPEYYGDQTIEAFYAMADITVSDDLRVIFGARNESTDILVQSFDADGDLKGDDGDISADNWMPSVNATYTIGQRSNIRLAASNTIARPNFRELSPFGSFQNIGGETFVGNPDLSISEIDNFDIRYEFFPNGGELFAVSLFQKNINNAIELVRDGPELTYQNVEQAEVLGLEMEARKTFALDKENMVQLSVGGNFSYIESEVQRADAEYQAKLFGDPDASRTRELQGQASEIGNIDVSYENFNLGSTLTLAYNYTGERLYAIEPGTGPDVYEAPSNQLDFIFSQQISNRMKLKFSLKNLLNENDEKFLPDGGTESIYSRYDKGISASLSFTYDLK